MNTPIRKKLIEVALPLEAINIASGREKSIRHGHPSTLHLYWARRPLAAARAVIFAQMVDDPSEYVSELISPGTDSRKAADRELRRQLAAWELLPKDTDESKPQPTLESVAIETERQRLFRLMEQLVEWENTNNQAVLQPARDEIWRSWRRTCAQNADHPQAKKLFDRDKLPAFHDPFAGGGALPLEAQRLGLDSYASDLNPVAVLINKAMIEIPPQFANQPPINPDAQAKKNLSSWKGAQGLAEDVRYYGQWMRDEAEKRIGHLYPKVKVTPEMVLERPDLKQYEGKELNVIAWLWARTVKSPNPAFASVDVPLASTFMLSTKVGKEAYVEPVIEGGGYRFTVRMGKPRDAERSKRGTKLSRGANFECLMSGIPIGADYIKAEGSAKRMGVRLMAIVAEGARGRVYLPPVDEHFKVAGLAAPAWKPELKLPDDPRNFWTVQYGLTTYGDLFTPRQLVALTTFSDLVGEAMQQARSDAIAAGLTEDPAPLRDGGAGATAYAEAVGVYLACGVNRTVNSVCSLVKWNNGRDQSNVVFARQALPMLWDFADVNPLAGAAGDIAVSCEGVAKALAATDSIQMRGAVTQSDASTQSITIGKLVSTDPPYYDNIGYADLSDFFYVWLRRSLRGVFPDLFATLTVPKAEELVATPYRHGSKQKAETFFLDGMTQAMHRLCEQSHSAFPVTIYYAFKQSETNDSGGQSSTGWETFLEAVIRSGFGISGTWPMRTERDGRPIGNDTNALASSIILVCRRRAATAPTATRREFLTALARELPRAIADLQRGNVAPVDLQQASIGPGMAIFTRYSKVLNSDGKPLSVRDALTLINQALDEILAQQEGDFDSDTRWALSWFEQFGFNEGDYGVAETLSIAKNTSVSGIVEAGIAVAGKGKVQLLKPEELPASWTPEGDKRLTVWDMVHHLIRTLEQGETSAATLLAKLGSRADVARELAYRLFSICERKKRSSDALRYNALVSSWAELLRLNQTTPSPEPQVQQTLEGMN